MIPKEILIPSEVNEINITAKSGEPLNNGGDTFGFVYRNECGNDENIDISSYEFEYTISLSNCIKKSGSTIIGDLQKGTGDDNNKLWFYINDLDLKPSIYDYTIKIIGSNSVIEGKLTVL